MLKLVRPERASVIFTACVCEWFRSAEKCENKVFYSEIQSILNQMEVPHTPGSVQARPVSRQETKLTTHSRSPASSPTGGKEKDDDSAPTVPSEKRLVDYVMSESEMCSVTVSIMSWYMRHVNSLIHSLKNWLK